MRFEERKWFGAREGEFQGAVLEESYSSFFWIVLFMGIFLGGTDRRVNQFFILCSFFSITTGSNFSLELEPKRIETSGLKTFGGFICVKLQGCLLLCENTQGHPEEESTGRVACSTEVISLAPCPLRLTSREHGPRGARLLSKPF